MKRCQREPEVDAYLDGELSAKDRSMFEQHLRACEACTRRLAELAALRAAFRALPEQRVGWDLAAAIDERLPSRRDRPAARRYGLRGMAWWFAPRGLAPAIALATGMGLGLQLGVVSSVSGVRTPNVMAVFDAVAPGGICLVTQACPSREAAP